MCFHICNYKYFLSDLNECKTFGSCSQDCQNYEGKYECSCSEGYEKTYEGTSVKCKSTGIELSQNKKNLTILFQKIFKVYFNLFLSFSGTEPYLIVVSEGSLWYTFVRSHIERPMLHQGLHRLFYPQVQKQI